MYRTIQGRAIAALLNPRAVVLVTCCDAQGKPNVLSVAWHTPLSHQPPLAGISVAQSRYSHGLIEQAGEFVINVMPASCREAVEICGRLSGRDCDKASLAGLTLQVASLVRPPFLSEALGALECLVVGRLSCGDHTLFAGQVLAARARAECFEIEAPGPAKASGRWLAPGGDVLLCLQGDRFGTWVEMGQP